MHDSESYNALIRTVGDEGDVAKLMALQDRILKKGFMPNCQSCKHIIMVYARLLLLIKRPSWGPTVQEVGVGEPIETGGSLLSRIRMVITEAANFWIAGNITKIFREN